MQFNLKLKWNYMLYLANLPVKNGSCGKVKIVKRCSKFIYIEIYTFVNILKVTLKLYISVVAY